MLARWFIGGGGSRMTVDFPGYVLTIEAVYDWKEGHNGA